VPTPTHPRFLTGSWLATAAPVGVDEGAAPAGHWRWLVPALLIAAISAAHYTASATTQLPHEIFRRLYYLPIILAAFSYGLRGGVAAALVTTAAYLPHALGHISHDPAAPIDKGLEVLLYNVVGVVTGLLVERERREKRDHQRTAESLRRTLEEREALEGELRRRERLAAVGQLSAGLAHEIRNPLGSIKGAAQILTGDLPTGDRDRLLAILTEESGRLDRVLTDFLTFARPRPPELRPMDLAACVRDTVALLATEAAEHGVTIDVLAPAGDLPDVSGDEDLLRQVVWNLVRNGLQAVGRGGRLEIRLDRVSGSLGARWVGGCIRMSISDDGPGIAAGDLDRIFNPFFTTRDGGTGLGLAICHRIVADHGGSIEVASRPEGGARFDVDLPVADALPA
jgi:two-component system sensor histidine kinase HydH